jgi:nucleoside-diphosphate-sugar epimerase
MEKILITGLSGFIGSNLKNKLSQYDIYDLECDLLDKEAIDKRLCEVNPDYIIHLAARTEVEKSFYEQTSFSSINYVGTVNMVESARNLTNLKLFIFSSTMETYGWQPESDLIRDDKEFVLPVFTEDTQQHPNAPYAVAKVGCEYYLKYAERAYNFPFCILRQTNTYGRSDNDFFVVEQVITQMLKNPNEINLGYGKPYRNFLYIDDLLNLYETIIVKSDLAKGHVFCTGPDNALTIEDLVLKIADKLNWKGSINWNTKPKRHGEIYVLNSTHKKATDILKWNPKVNLDTGLDLTIDVWKNKLQ